MKGDATKFTNQITRKARQENTSRCDARGERGKNDDSKHVLIHCIDEKLPSIHIDGCADKKVCDCVVISCVWVGFGADICDAFEPVVLEDVQGVNR